MLQSPGLIYSALCFLLVIGPLVFVHELGHYLVGRACGVKAEVFSIGFGRALIGWTDRRGTRWKIGWLPLGGYVKFAGDMNPASTPSREWLSLPAEERARTFQAKPLWQRFAIVAAGPLINFLLAILIFMGVFAFAGYPTTPAIVSGVLSGSAADKAGVLPGDRILAINGKNIENFKELSDYVLIRPGANVMLVLQRQGEQLRVPATLADKEIVDRFDNRARIGQLGVSPDAIAFEKLPLHRLPGQALAETRDTLEMIIVTTRQLIMGERSVQELGGPLKIAQFSGQQASMGLLPLVWLMALISINLGFINLLPIPMLDGGHLLFYLLEGVRRKPLNPEAQEWAFKAGLAALLMLMVFVTLNDLASFGLWTRLGGLIG
ncbi:MAG TPA: RIP metalloprotease RseP [Allosphingosinicella sp.]|nr:RIP metalloprotease RseP [Allosphingosinicella sp.]